jgi:transcriptional regulator with PAS, ATPase and Fis domain
MIETRRNETRPLEDAFDGREQALMFRVVSGELKGREFSLSDDRPFILGASFEATLQVPDNAVSRLHLELVARHGRVRARDLTSTNGSFFEGARFGTMDLFPGAIVRIGETELQIVATDEVHPLPPYEKPSFGKLIGRSRKMREVFAILERAARIDATVLLAGETGTGKELVAESIHEASARRDQPFVVVDCASIPANLIESELFGHRKGAYTHAIADRMGAFAAADGGTIFLDEIGELPLDLQPRLLRALETRTVKAVGADQFERVDVRVIAATNRDLEREVEAGRFRRDLYYRLAVIQVRIPPLRERREDIIAIAKHLASILETKTGKKLDLAPQTIAALLSHDWPGNVRELRNVIENAASLSTKSLGIAMKLAGAEVGVNEVGALGLEVFYDLPFREARRRAIEAFELGYVRHAVETADGSVKKAAVHAGLHRNMLHRILARPKP